MSAELQNLINASIDAGEINDSRRKIIYEKALHMGISREECDIYIENAITNQRNTNAVLTANRKYQGAVLVVFGLIDLVYGIDCATKGRYYEDIALVCILSGLALLVFGLFILKLKFISKGRIAALLYWIAGLYVPTIILGSFSKGHLSPSMSFVSGLLFYLYIVVFRYKLFSNQIADKMGNSGMVKKIDTFRKKILSSEKIENFLGK